MNILFRESQLVGFDLDGVILDHTMNKIRLAARYGVTLTPEETHAERIGTHFSPETYREIKQELYGTPSEISHSLLMQGAFDGLSTLKDRGIPFTLISLQQNPIFAEQLLEFHGLWGEIFTPENIHFARDGEEKSFLAGRLGVTHFVDDESNILDLMPQITHRILFDTFDQFPDRDDLARVRGWGELLDLLVRA